MTQSLTAVAFRGIARIVPRKTRIGLVAGGLGAYWPQFPALLPQLRASARRVSERLARLDCEVVDVGFISDAPEGAAAERREGLARMCIDTVQQGAGGIENPFFICPFTIHRYTPANTDGEMARVARERRRIKGPFLFPAGGIQGK